MEDILKSVGCRKCTDSEYLWVYDFIGEIITHVYFDVEVMEETTVEEVVKTICKTIDSDRTEYQREKADKEYWDNYNPT